MAGDVALDKSIIIGVSYIPLIIIVIGVIGNTISFLIFVFHKEMKKYNSMVFLSFIAVCDTIALFGWNLDNYFLPHTGIVNYIEYRSLFTCKLISFLQYTSMQCSGMLYSMVSVDRFFTIISRPGSFISKLPFGTRKSSFGWCVGIIACLCIVNSHVLMFNGYYETVVTNSTVNTSQTIGNMTVYSTSYISNEETKLRCYASLQYQFVPMWDRAYMIIYTFIPFSIMVTFNCLLIFKVLFRDSHGKSKSTSEDARKKKLTISLITLTVSFILMTAPCTIMFGFFLNFLLNTRIGNILMIVLDSIMFLQQTTLFTISFITNKTFAGFIISSVKSVFGMKESQSKYEGTNNKSTANTRSVAVTNNTAL